MTDTVVLPVSPLASFQQGSVIAGKYRLDHELGRGAMGMVWAATHRTLGQKVAIKLIAGEQAQSADARRRFGLEAKAAARLKSRHAVQVYDDGETPEGVPYIVMEYLDGETLEARLERQHDLGLPEAIRITTHVGRALAKAHARGIVHRDLKSGNVFIAKTEDDELGWIAKVLDFGVAKLADMANASTTKTGTLVGTPLFMSPEQIRGASQVDHRADLYSLGMVFYNMVTGVHAFSGPSYSDVLVAICTEPLPDIRDNAPWLPEPIADWFRKACAREAADRFQSADEMIESLHDAAGPNSRMGRRSVPEEVSGPSGTLMGHVPPHAANTIAVPNVVLTRAPSDDTLRSRTGPDVLAGERESRPSVAAPRFKFRHVAFALAGVGLALIVVLGAVLLRYANRPVAESAEPARREALEPAGAARVESPPAPTRPLASAVPARQRQVLPPESTETTNGVHTAAPRVSSERPQHVRAPARSVIPRPERADAPASALPGAVRAPKSSAPDMGF